MLYKLTLTLDIQREFESFEQAKEYYENFLLKKISQKGMWNFTEPPEISGKIKEILSE